MRFLPAARACALLGAARTGTAVGLVELRGPDGEETEVVRRPRRHVRRAK